MTTEGVSSDSRIVDVKIRETYPYPIASAWNRVLDATEPADRVNRCFSCVEVVFRTIGSIQIQDYLRGESSTPVEEELSRLARPSLGQWLGLVREITRYVTARPDMAAFIPEAGQWLFADNGKPSAALRQLNELITLRNKTAGHGSAAVSASQHRALESRVTGEVRQMLANMPWIASYRLFRLRSFAMKRNRSFEGKVQFLVGSDERPEPAAATWSSFLLSETVYLTNPTGDQFMEVSPFIRFHPDALGIDRCVVFKEAPKLKQVAFVHDETGAKFKQPIDRENENLPFEHWLEERGGREPWWFVDDAADGTFAHSAGSVAAVDEMLNGRYALKELLGEGGTATVHRAWDSQLECFVAIKLLKAAIAKDSGLVARFRREAQTMLKVEHPNILSAQDILMLDDGRVGIKMQLATGGNLKDRLAHTPMGQEDIARFGQQMIDALVHLHEQGIVHRDIKPSNFLLDEDGNIFLADFGIALTDEQRRLTRTHAVLGTLAYMSPEQQIGDDVGPASDIYSLAKVLHEMTAGSMAVGSPGDGIAGSMGDLIRAMGRPQPEARTSGGDLRAAWRRAVSGAGRSDFIAGLSGRDPEQLASVLHVDDGINQDKVRWVNVCGQAGSGKTRLVQEALRVMSDRDRRDASGAVLRPPDIRWFDGGMTDWPQRLLRNALDVGTEPSDLIGALRAGDWEYALGPLLGLNATMSSETRAVARDLAFPGHIATTFASVLISKFAARDSGLVLVIDNAVEDSKLQFLRDVCFYWALNVHNGPSGLLTIVLISNVELYAQNLVYELPPLSAADRSVLRARWKLDGDPGADGETLVAMRWRATARAPQLRPEPEDNAASGLVGRLFAAFSKSPVPAKSAVATTTAPHPVPEGIVCEADRLLRENIGFRQPPAQLVLAAALGPSFLLSDFAVALGRGVQEARRELKSVVGSSASVSILQPVNDRPDWYEFVPPMIHQSILSAAPPEARKHAVDSAITALQVGLELEWTDSGFGEHPVHQLCADADRLERLCLLIRLQDVGSTRRVAEHEALLAQVLCACNRVEGVKPLALHALGWTATTLTWDPPTGSVALSTQAVRDRVYTDLVRVLLLLNDEDFCSEVVQRWRDEHEAGPSDSQALAHVLVRGSEALGRNRRFVSASEWAEAAVKAAEEGSALHREARFLAIWARPRHTAEYRKGAVALLTALITQLERESDRTDRALLAGAFNLMGDLRGSLVGNNMQSFHPYIRSIRLKEALHDVEGLAYSYGGLARGYFYRADSEESLSFAAYWFERDLTACDALGDVANMSAVRSQLADVVWRLGERDYAEELLKRGLEIAKYTGNHVNQVFALIGEAKHRFREGDQSRAADCLSKALDVFEDWNNRQDPDRRISAASWADAEGASPWFKAPCSFAYKGLRSALEPRWSERSVVLFDWPEAPDWSAEHRPTIDALRARFDGGEE